MTPPPPDLSFVVPGGLPTGALPRLRVEDANLDPDSVLIEADHEPLSWGTPLPPGTHELLATASDRAGNFATTSAIWEAATPCEFDTWIEYKPATTRLSAAHYFPWYVGSPPCPVNSAWCNCFSNPKPGNPVPARGFYDSGNQSVVNAQLDQMVAHGIDVVSVEWTGDPLHTANLVNRVVPALATRNLKWVLLYDTSVRLAAANPPINFNDSAIRNKFISDFQGFAASANYFKHPKYLKFGTRAVVYIYVTRAITGTSTNIRSAFDQIRQAAAANGLGLYIVAGHLFWGTIDWGKLSWTGAAAVTSFAPVDPQQGVPQGSSSRPIRQWADKMADLYNRSLSAMETQLSLLGIVDLTPGIFTQVDWRGLAACFNNPNLPSNYWHLADASDWSYMIQRAGAWTEIAEKHRLASTCTETVTTNGTSGTSIVWSYSYNEWYEAAGIEELAVRNPRYPLGFGLDLLQTLQQALP